MQRLINPIRPDRLDELLEAPLMARLSQLDVTSRKLLSGKLKGERRSKRRGQSVEFADHRQYSAGDDLRHIDWNIFGRLDRLFIKLFLEEEDLSLHIVLDASTSMDCGKPSKFLLGQKLTLAMGYIGLVNLHRLSVSIIGGASRAAAQSETPAAPAAASSGVSVLRDMRGKRRLQDLARFLIDVEPVGNVSFTEACKRIALTRRGKGVMLIISDYLFKEGYESGLRLLVGQGYDVFTLQILSPDELSPTMGGDLTLKDVEDGDMAELTITAPLLRKYKATVAAYCTRWRDFCNARGMTPLTVSSDAAVDTLVLEYLRRRGLVS